ncbi:MAG TPA: lysyl oxidase family protein [Vicinamibacteria bacterium]
MSTCRSVVRLPGLPIVLAAVALAAGAPSAAAAAGHLKNRYQAVLWSGTVGPGDAADIPECAATACERFDLGVNLPPWIWNHRPGGGVEVSVRWLSGLDNVLLYVYRQGSLVASSTGIIATAQSVLLPAAPDGSYVIYLAHDPTSLSPEIAFEGVAEVEFAPRPHPARFLLPDLVARPQRNVTFDTPILDFFEPLPPPGENCFGTEKAEEGAQTCLRFDQVLANVGKGALEMRFAISKDPSSTERAVTQRIYRSDGPEHFQERSAGEWELHEAHGHYHFEGFALSKLWRTDKKGRHKDKEPLRTGRKVSFCIVDIEIDTWAEKGNGPRTYQAPICLFPTEEDAENAYLVQGMTRGWADVYDWYLPGQYVEVTGVPDGVYILETLVDPDGLIKEADESNNCGSVYVRLKDVDEASRSAELLGPGPACRK